jgi:flagellar hook protein FlgE
MGIFDALYTSVGGLSAQSYALQNISGNIANASTVGYKGVGTRFEDLIPTATTPSRQVAGGVTAHAQATIDTQGTVLASTVATHMAINGDGFFSVQKATALVDNAPVFSGGTDYTRRGDFQLNANGNLINGAGYYLMGVTVDPKTGNPTGNVPHVLQFQNNFIPAQATSAIQYAANLPTQPNTPASSHAASGTLTAAGGLNPADFASNPLPLGTPAVPFADNTITGSAAKNQAATPAPITAATALSGKAPSNSLPKGFVAGDTITVNGATLTFVASGATGNQLNVTDTVGTLVGRIQAITGVAPTINASTGAITQFASSSGAATINSLTQNGFAAGQLQSVAVNTSGLVVGTFSNGQNVDLAEVTLSHFKGTNYLKALDGGAYEATDLSGPAISGASGKISGSSLEGSNTDIADEFTKLIVTQQAYSANTKVITTANGMVQDLLSVLR